MPWTKQPQTASEYLRQYLLNHPQQQLQQLSSIGQLSDPLKESIVKSTITDWNHHCSTRANSDEEPSKDSVIDNHLHLKSFIVASVVVFVERILVKLSELCCVIEETTNLPSFINSYFSLQQAAQNKTIHNELHEQQFTSTKPGGSFQSSGRICQLPSRPLTINGQCNETSEVISKRTIHIPNTPGPTR